MSQRSVVPILLMLLLIGCGAQPAAPTTVPATEPATLSTLSPTTAAPDPSATTPPPTSVATATAPLPTDTPVPTVTAPPPATATLLPAPTATEEDVTTSSAGGRPLATILILAPGPGSAVRSPLRVQGEADSTFEQNIVVRVVTQNGEELALQPTTIQADLGQRGPWEIAIPFEVAEETSALVQVFSSSARDGAIEHLSSVGIRLLPESGGEQRVTSVLDSAERIAITAPAANSTVRGGVVEVAGIALASFEQTLIVEMLDEEGNTLAREPVIVDAPDLGEPGTFTISLPYSINRSTLARVVVRDPSPAFEGTLHLNSVTVTLEP